LTKGKILGFSHEFSIASKPSFRLDVDVVMIAPVRATGGFTRKAEAFRPDLSAGCQWRAHELALCYAYGIGSTRAGVLQTTFKEETESDLFG
jgi:ketol-acid reductoisomerase